jgi:hypothetical protein
MNKFKLTITAAMLLSAWQAQSFCGFYVAKIGTQLFNNKSEVILVRDGKNSTITMSNDFKGDVKDFAMVVPVPVVLRKDQIRITNRNVFARLGEYSSPRLVEYYDQNPCEQLYEMDDMVRTTSMESALEMKKVPAMTKDKNEVTIEAQYQIGEYDILILSAKESEGLKTWLIANGYAIPDKAEKVLEPYIKSNMKFFVVKVNLDKHKQTGFDFLSPIQIEFESDKFMLPIRLGMANSSGEQDMIVYAFTKTGRVETTNYRTVQMPTARNIPVFAKQKFEQFYFDLFDKQYKNEGKNTVFLEYAWNVTPTWGGMKCDPCIGPPPIFTDLSQAGVKWANNQLEKVFFTRLHVRYSEGKFPEDLFFQVTPNQENYQARYIITNPATGSFTCEAGKIYLDDLKNRRKRELMELASLTGWNTTKYTKYVNEGSAWVDEKEDIIPIGSAPGTPNDKGPMSKPFFFGLFAMLLLLLAAVQYSKTHKKVSIVQS